ncbi:hypothetical protein EV193_105417 [Herbihabitans rhizosphaerae]|uniref:SH3 domain-containing protein n=1 Tax=Herbihabitans rhizosphaerae TaxID=1872711 RepID=A0A4Q7KNH2_9PSEU|nr:SH3 domain-containing protein [Herbihabitans rhizosphaerae]RZS37857.1 hypothetical protein EV193_105417 [Herbihabitans rhizosphaerae]
MKKRIIAAIGGSAAAVATAVSLLAGPTATAAPTEADESGPIGASAVETAPVEINPNERHPAAMAADPRISSRVERTYCKYRVTADGVAVREDPKKGSPRVGLLYKGQWFKGVYGENMNGYKVGYHDSVPQVGWVYAKYLDLIPGTCYKG